MANWLETSALPIAHERSAFATLNDEFHVIGGWKQGQVHSNVHYVYSHVTHAWTQLANFPYAFRDAMEVNHNGVLYVFGGNDSSWAYTNRAYRYNKDTDTWTAIANLPVVMGMSVAISDGTYIYILSGYQAGAYTGNSWRYDPVANTYTAIAAKPTPSGYMHGFYHNGRCYVVGGYNATTYAQSIVESYDPATNTWRSEPSLPAPKWQHRLALRGGFAWCFGGTVWNGTANVPSNEVLSMDMDTGVWTVQTADAMPKALSSHAIAEINDPDDSSLDFIIAGGMGSGGTVSANTYLWEGEPAPPTGGTQVALDGSISANSGMTAVLRKIFVLSGQSSSQSALTATLATTKGLTGRSDSVSSVSAEMTVIRSLVGNVGAQSSVLEAALWRNRSVEADITAQSSVLPMNITKLVPMNGQIGADSFLSGSMVRGTTLQGEIQAITTGTGQLSRVALLQGNLTAVSNVEISQLLRIRELTAEISGSSALMADFDVEGEVRLSGQINSQSSMSANLINDFALRGNIEALSEMTVELGVLKPISGELIGNSSVSGRLSKIVPFAGTIEGISSLAIEFESGTGLSGRVEAVSSLFAELDRLAALNGSIEAISSTDGELNQLLGLSGLIQAVSDLRIIPPVDTFLEVTNSMYDSVEAEDSQRLSYTITDGQGRHIQFEFQFKINTAFLESLEFRVKGTPGEPFNLRVFNVRTNRWDRTVTYDGELETFVSLTLRDVTDFLDAETNVRFSMRSVYAFTSGALTLSTDYAELRKRYIQYQQGV